MFLCELRVQGVTVGCLDLDVPTPDGLLEGELCAGLVI